ncbi:hypothetical protein Tco_1283833 [Tanacetum coccineum]
MHPKASLYSARNLGGKEIKTKPTKGGLDAKLNKTEEVIVDLRSEIRKAREQLEQVKNSHMLQCDKNSNPAKETVRSGPRSDNVLDSDTDLIIRAIERNLVDGKSFSEDKPSEDINTRKNLAITVDKEKRGKCAPSSMVADNIDTHTDTKYVNLSEVVSINSSVAKDQTITSKRLERVSPPSKSLSPSTGASKQITYDVKDTKVLSESVVKKQEDAAKESAVVACDTNENNSLKYTFSRRRKKVLSPKTDYLTCQMKEKLSSSPDNENCNLIEGQI